MKRILIIVPCMLLILFLPAAGVMLSGKDIYPYLLFPPSRGYVKHAPFSWGAFSVLAGVIILLLAHPVAHIIRGTRVNPRGDTVRSFPWWGYAGVAAVIFSWIIAWTRMPLFHEIQRWTFLPLWLSYIITVNAISVKRRGVSLLTDRTGYLLSLFPASAVFWWLFEYLNRFTANWYYAGTGELSPLRYFCEATMAFSTVLPAVMSTAELVNSFPRLYAGSDSYLRVKKIRSRAAALLIMVIFSSGLLFTAILPEILFPLLWISPFAIIVPMQVIAGDDTILDSLEYGDWRAVAVYASAALICGFFWEMWNSGSLARWMYSIPYVQRFRVFEMPLLGYAGYLPFGLECAAVAGILSKRGDEPWRLRD